MPVRALGSTVCTVVACFRLTACRLRRPSSRLLSFFGSILDSFRNLFVRGLTVIPITDARQKQLVRPSADCTGFQGKFFKIPEFRNKVHRIRKPELENVSFKQNFRYVWRHSSFVHSLFFA